MADIHILPEAGEAVAVPEERVAEYLRTGRFAPTALYWREGMADWEPLATFPLPVRASARLTEPIPLAALDGKRPHEGVPRGKPAVVPAPRRVQSEPLAAAPAPPAPARVPGRSRYRFRRNPWPLTIAVEVLLAICLIITLLELAQGWDRYQAFGSPPADVTAAPAAATEPAIEAGPSPAEIAGVVAPAPTVAPADPRLEWTGWGANLLLLIVYLMWVYRTAINCCHLSSITRLKPRLAVGNYFIPFVNLFRPVQDMQEIWRVSGNPSRWLNDRGSILVVLWWGLTLVTIGASLEGKALFSTAETAADRLFASQFFLAVKGIQAAWYVAFIVLVARVISRQARVIARGRRSAKPAGSDGS